MLCYYKGAGQACAYIVPCLPEPDPCKDRPHTEHNHPSVESVPTFPRASGNSWTTVNHCDSVGPSLGGFHHPLLISKPDSSIWTAWRGEEKALKLCLGHNASRTQREGEGHKSSQGQLTLMSTVCPCAEEKQHLTQSDNDSFSPFSRNLFNVHFQSES